MWKIWHKLFGWEYVYIRNSATSKIVRAFKAPNGEMMFQAYSFQVTVIPHPLDIKGEILDGWRTIPLTPMVTKELEK